MPDTLSLYSRVRNISGAARFYGYLPPHGRTLAANESITIKGRLEDHMLTGGRLNLRKFTALENDLLEGRIEITKHPEHLLYDPTTDAMKQLKLDNSVLGVEDPSYGSYTGSP